MTEESVFIAARGNGGRRDIYHTDKNCRLLEQANTIHEWPLRSLNDRRRLCRICAGGDTNPGASGEGHIQSLRAAAKEGPS